MTMTETEEKIVEWLKEQKIFVWMFGTFVFTCIFVLFFYALTKYYLPPEMTEMTGIIGLMFIIIMPALSFAITHKATNIFLIESEEKERWRQRELKRIIGDLKNARKMIWSMGFSKQLSDAMYKKTRWDGPERAPVHKVIEILSELVKKKKKEEPVKELRADEIKYLVQQKRKKASVLARKLLEEEKLRRKEELDLLEELIEDTDSEVRELAQEDAILETKIDKVAEDEVVYHDVYCHPVTKKMLEAESELPDSEHERIHDSMEWHADPTPEEVTVDAKIGEAALKSSEAEPEKKSIPMTTDETVAHYIHEAKKAEAESIKETIDILETIEAGDSYRELMADPEADVSAEIETLKARLDEVQEENAPAGVAELMELHGIPPQKLTHSTGTNDSDFELESED